MAARQLYILYGVLLLCVIMNIGLWTRTHRLEPHWPNVPKPPSELNLTSSFFGDTALAYRVWALALQNFGNAGGAFTPLKDYNYQYVGEWLDRLDGLDPQSNFAPYLASYYFGASQSPKEQLPYIIAYLEKIGTRPEGEKWRFLAQAVYLARHKMQDMPEALRLAKKLSSIYRPGMPAWTKQMEVLITNEVGDKEAAYILMKSILATETAHMQPQEINFMVDYICTKILTTQQAAADTLCAPQAKGN